MRIISSNANLPPVQAVSWGVEQHLRFMADTGYEGFELVALRSRLAAEIASGAGRAALQDVIASTHQPFRRERVGEVLKVPRSAADVKKLAGSLAAAGAMPRVDSSLPYMLRAQAAAGRSVNAVVYPDEQMVAYAPLRRSMDYTKWRGQFANVIWQPTADALAAWGVLSSNAQAAMEGMKAHMRKRGLDGVCFDTYHWVSPRQGLEMPAWENALPQLLRDGDCVEMHLCPARPDMGGDTRQLEQILRGDIMLTEAGDMLACVRENVPSDSDFLITTELPDMAITQADIGVMTRMDVHRELVAATQLSLGA